MGKATYSGQDGRMQAARQAYAALSLDDQVIVDDMAAELRTWLHERHAASAAGRGTCLEIIAAIGQALCGQPDVAG